MSRSRRGTLVECIATHAPFTHDKVPKICFNDQLLEKLKTLESNSKTLPICDVIDNNNNETLNQTLFFDLSKYHEYIDKLDQSSVEHAVVIKQLHTVGNQLNSLIQQLSNISLKTTEFQEITGLLYDDYQNKLKLNDCITQKLSYFENLHLVMRKLNQYSSPNSVKKESFKILIEKIDDSMEFIYKNMDFKDSEMYMIRFKQCLLKACELIKTYLTNVLKQLTDEITTKSSKAICSVSKDALIYSSFGSDSETFKGLYVEILRRKDMKHNKKCSAELNSILNNILNEYFLTRIYLLTDSIWSQLNNESENNKNITLVSLLQDNILYFTELCQKEYRLFTKFFVEEKLKTEINLWLVKLCEPFYDYIRVKILRENSILILCDSINILNKYYQFEEFSHEYELQFKGIQFDKIFEPIIQELQSRLVFRCQVYIDQEIVNYQPKRDTVIISQRKVHMEKNVDGVYFNDTDQLTKEYLKNFESINDKNLLNPLISYYLPLIRALALLSKLYQMVNSSVFDDLAHCVVHECINSLRKAYSLVNFSNSENLDDILGYLSNLLLLKTQIETFDIRYIANETYLDFSGLSDFLKSISSWDSSKMLSLARSSIPKIVNNMMDAKSELALELRLLINDFTNTASAKIIGDHLSLTMDMHELLHNNIELKSSIQIHLSHIYDQITTFIQSENITTHLIEAIKQLIIQLYSDYYNHIVISINDNGLDKSLLTEIMSIDMFTNLMNDIIEKLK